MKSKKKITFYVMGQKGFEVLKNFIKEFGENCVSEVITAEDDSLSESFYKEIIQLCKKRKIKCYDKKNNVRQKGDYSFAISWRWLIKNYNNLIIFHDSLLPKYRGFAPLVNALIKGEKIVGVSAIFASESYDEGNIISQKQLQIKYPVKIQTVIENVIPLYCELVNNISYKILQGEKIIAKKQDETKATYSPWRDEEDYFIDWAKSSDNIKRFIDAVGKPYKGACSYMNNELVRIFDAEIFPQKTIETPSIGKVLFIKNGFPVVNCGNGLLMIKKIVYDKTGGNALPLKKFRTRFTENCKFSV